MRVSKGTRDRINRLAASMNLSATAMIDKLVQDWEDAQLLREASRLSADPAMPEHAWDHTVGDGLVDEDFGTWHE